MDKTAQLIEDLKTGELTLTHIQIAIRASIRERDDLPEGIKGLLAGSSDRNPGLVLKVFRLIGEIIGNMELAYRRGADFRND